MKPQFKRILCSELLVNINTAIASGTDYSISVLLSVSLIGLRILFIENLRKFPDIVVFVNVHSFSFR
jgi:hypothetical protein